MRRSVDGRLGDATKVFGELRWQLGQVAEMATRMEALGREIDELQGILKAPKLRGQLGESQLEECLRQLLPPGAFETQYRFSDGQVVDAVIKLRDHLVPVDAKFPSSRCNACSPRRTTTRDARRAASSSARSRAGSTKSRRSTSGRGRGRLSSR
jgi:DNA anti-recombination protein RmuC